MARKIERWAFEQASRVVMNSESAVTLYRDAYEGILPAEHFEFIRNHFDETLYDPLPSPPSIDDPFRVVFWASHPHSEMVNSSLKPGGVLSTAKS